MLFKYVLLESQVREGVIGTTSLLLKVLYVVMIFT